jgi:hypothetical protein
MSVAACIAKGMIRSATLEKDLTYGPLILEVEASQVVGYAVQTPDLPPLHMAIGERLSLPEREWLAEAVREWLEM